jgi:hypothetical protein
VPEKVVEYLNTEKEKFKADDLRELVKLTLGYCQPTETDKVYLNKLVELAISADGFKKQMRDREKIIEKKDEIIEKRNKTIDEYIYVVQKLTQNLQSWKTQCKNEIERLNKIIQQNKKDISQLYALRKTPELPAAVVATNMQQTLVKENQALKDNITQLEMQMMKLQTDIGRCNEELNRVKTSTNIQKQQILTSLPEEAIPPPPSEEIPPPPEEIPPPPPQDIIQNKAKTPKKSTSKTPPKVQITQQEELKKKIEERQKRIAEKGPIKTPSRKNIQIPKNDIQQALFNALNNRRTRIESQENF